jgi:hypothetical protein
LHKHIQKVVHISLSTVPIFDRLTFPPLKINCAQCAHCAQSVKFLVLQWFSWAHWTKNRWISIVPTVPNFAPVCALPIRFNPPRHKALARIHPLITWAHGRAIRKQSHPCERYPRPAPCRPTWAHCARRIGYFWRAFDLLPPLPRREMIRPSLSCQCRYRGWPGLCRIRGPMLLCFRHR